MVLGATNFTSHEIKTFEEIKIISRKYRFPRFLREENEKKKERIAFDTVLWNSENLTTLCK